VDVSLADRTRFEIRPIRPDDKASLARGLTLLSPETVRRRFLTAKPSFSSAELRYLTEVDGHDHVALVAVPRDRPGHIAGVGRFVRLPDRPDTAEFAIVVADRFQRRGLGTRLARQLTEEARRHGIRRFTATTLSDNVAVERLVETISEGLIRVPAGSGVRDLVLELAA